MFDWGRKWRNRNKKKLQSSGIKALDQPTFKCSSQYAWLPAVLSHPTPLFVPAVPGLSFQATCQGAPPQPALPFRQADSAGAKL